MSRSGAPVTTSYFDAGLSASWEVDIFGKVASEVKGRDAAFKATRAQWAGTMVSMSAQIAATYMQLRMYQCLLEVAHAHLASQQKIVAIAKARYEATISSKLDVAQAEETYYSTAATLPPIENSIYRSINALALLTALPRDSVSRLVAADSVAMPQPLRIMQWGIPADILRRRPDIAEAEMQVAEYAAQLGMARKDFLPALAINGSIGTQAHDISDMFKTDSFTWSVAPTLSWTLFEGFNRKYAVASARESMRAAVDNYNLVVSTAIEETDNAMCSYTQSIRHMKALEKEIEANAEAYRLAVDRYKSSLSPMSDVVNAQINAYECQSQYIQAQGSALAALVSLYEALGGGFDANSLEVKHPCD